MLNIGDFARFAGVSVRMLRHYDALGLLVPTQVDPLSGYRRYDPALLARAHRLVALRELGFGLDQIGELLAPTVDATTLRAVLERRRAELQTQLMSDTARLAEVERRLRLVEGEEPMSALAFEEKELPALRVLAHSAVVGDMSEIGPAIGPMFEGLDGALADAGDPPSHPGVAWYEADGERLRLSAGYLGRAAEVGGAHFVDLPAQPRAVTTTYIGPMSGIGTAWQELGEHVRRCGLELAGPCRELYHEVRGPQEGWITELQQPVR